MTKFTAEELEYADQIKSEALGMIAGYLTPAELEPEEPNPQRAFVQYRNDLLLSEVPTALALHDAVLGVVTALSSLSSVSAIHAREVLRIKAESVPIVGDTEVPV